MPQPTTTVSKRKIVTAVAGVAVIVAGLGFAASKLGPKTPPCNDPAAAIASLPSGGTFTGTGTYCTAGILVTQPVTLNFNNGTVIDTQTTDVKPIIEVKDTTDVTVENVNLTGGNTSGTFHGSLVGQEGVSIRSSSDVTVTNVNTSDTYGDGLDVFISSTKPQVASTEVHVNGMVITNPGRDCVSPAAVTDSTFDNVTCAGKIPDSALDFESDIRGIGDSGLTFTNLVAKGGINIIEPVGTLTFANTQATSRVYVDSIGAEISYSGSFVCERRAPGACVKVVNGTLTLAPGTTSTYQPGTAKPTMIPYLATPPGVIVQPS